MSRCDAASRLCNGDFDGVGRVGSGGKDWRIDVLQVEDASAISTAEGKGAGGEGGGGEAPRAPAGQRRRARQQGEAEEAEGGGDDEEEVAKLGGGGG